MRLGLAVLGATFSFFPHPLVLLYGGDAVDPGSRRAFAVIETDDDVCWIADVGEARDPRGCGDARIAVPRFGEGMRDADARIVADVADEFFVGVTKTYSDEVDVKLLRVLLEVDGVIVDRGSTTFDRVLLDSLGDD